MTKDREPEPGESANDEAGARHSFVRFPLELTPEEEEAWAEEFVRRLRAGAGEPDAQDR